MTLGPRGGIKITSQDGNVEGVTTITEGWQKEKAWRGPEWVGQEKSWIFGGSGYGGKKRGGVGEGGDPKLGMFI